MSQQGGEVLPEKRLDKGIANYYTGFAGHVAI
jgi:hypothetical protein